MPKYSGGASDPEQVLPSFEPPSSQLPGCSRARCKVPFNRFPRIEWLKMTRRCAKGILDQFKLILHLRHSHRINPEFKLVTEITCVRKE